MSLFRMSPLTEEETQLKLKIAMSLAPPWSEEGGVQPFTWSYGPRELIVERKKLAEIMVLWGKV